MEKTLLQQLEAYGASDYYGFHMPGHKRNKEMFHTELPFHIDITEIEGFDDLHHPEGILLEAQEKAAQVFGAGQTHFLINGSTVGILSAIFSVTNQGDEILVSRNCHKSVYHAMELRELTPRYLYPRFDEEYGLNLQISVEDVKTALEKYPNIKAIMIVSPTYDGMVSEVDKISEVAHDQGIPLIVDEAHGAHFGFHPYFPKSSNELGADLVIQSLHKTLPSLTQTALLHVNGDLVDHSRVKKYLGMFQSSSPSYILMSSIDGCVNWMAGEERTVAFASFVEGLKRLRSELKKLKCLKIPEVKGSDFSKIVISTAGTGLSSRELYHILLEQYHLQMEMVAGSYVLAMTTVGDTPEGLERLARALVEIDEKLDKGLVVRPCMDSFPETDQEEFLLCQGGEKLSWEAAIGHISSEYAYLYPPGSPMLVPGEVVTEDCVSKLVAYKKKGFTINIHG